MFTDEIEKKNQEKNKNNNKKMRTKLNKNN
jgi:hypothetical protein